MQGVDPSVSPARYFPFDESPPREIYAYLLQPRANMFNFSDVDPAFAVWPLVIQYYTNVSGASVNVLIDAHFTTSNSSCRFV